MKKILLMICCLLAAGNALLAQTGADTDKSGPVTFNFVVQDSIHYDSIGATFWPNYFKRGHM